MDHGSSKPDILELGAGCGCLVAFAWPPPGLTPMTARTAGFAAASALAGSPSLLSRLNEVGARRAREQRRCRVR